MNKARSSSLVIILLIVGTAVGSLCLTSLFVLLLWFDNNKVETIPSNIVAGLTGFKIKEYFEAGPEADDAPDVSF